MLLPMSCLCFLFLKMRMKKRTAGKEKKKQQSCLLRITYRIASIPYNFVMTVFAI